MKKQQKKYILGTLLFVLASIQIINFAQLDITKFPQFFLDFTNRNILNLIVADVNWPFKMFNYTLYYLFGWIALITPLFFIVLGTTYFTQRDTQKVKRKRIILILGMGELAFLVYVVNYVSFIILPDTIQPGKIALIFARYLRKIGGFSFIFVFFAWSFISYILYIKKSSWKAFFRKTGTIIKLFFMSFSNAIGHLFQTGKINRQQRKREKQLLKLDDRKEIEFQEESEEEEDTDSEETETEILESENQKTIKQSVQVDKIPDNEDIIQAEFQAVQIEDSDSTKTAFKFNYSALLETEISTIDKDKINELVKKVENIFKSLGIVLNHTGVTTGPRLIRLEYQLPSGVQLKEIEKCKEELSFRLGGINLDIELPIPNTDRFGIYLGREEPDKPGLGSYLKDIDDRKENIPLLVGITADGNSYWEDITSFPHLLIGGTTGSGKSVFLNNVILNLMAVSEYKPVSIILIDPKRVEFAPYKNIPQLAHKIITDVNEAMLLTEEAEQLMEQRYKQITKIGVRNITEYNEQEDKKIPYLFIIIDEFADFVMQDQSDQFKKSIIRLAQKSRAVGIHIVIATQRPSADIIDGLIKANFPARISFKTSSKVDSRIILDENGAEDLLGKGDMIIKTTSNPRKRLQGIFVSLNEIKDLVSR
ncbi:MAG: DUF87 domain-containing protein [Spirochaetales bacterium]|nr:DUF87 domain-containing protein [Spirochaetales bacterium]